MDATIQGSLKCFVMFIFVHCLFTISSLDLLWANNDDLIAEMFIMLEMPFFKKNFACHIFQWKNNTMGRGYWY